MDFSIYGQGYLLVALCDRSMWLYGEEFEETYVVCWLFFKVFNVAFYLFTFRSFIPINFMSLTALSQLPFILLVSL